MICEASTPACPDGDHEAFHYHHVVMRSQGGTHDPGNLLAVCPPAHRWIHDHPAESYKRGWLRHRWDAEHDRRRAVVALALAAVYDGAGPVEAQAFLDHLGDHGATVQLR